MFSPPAPGGAVVARNVPTTMANNYPPGYKAGKSRSHVKRHRFFDVLLYSDCGTGLSIARSRSYSLVANVTVTRRFVRRLSVCLLSV